MKLGIIDKRDWGDHVDDNDGFTYNKMNFLIMDCGDDYKDYGVIVMIIVIIQAIIMIAMDKIIVEMT